MVTEPTYSYSFMNYLSLSASMYFLYPGLFGQPYIHCRVSETEYGKPTNNRPTACFFKAHLHLKRILKLNKIVYEFTFRVLINCGTEDTLK